MGCQPNTCPWNFLQIDGSSMQNLRSARPEDAKLLMQMKAVDLAINICGRCALASMESTTFAAYHRQYAHVTKLGAPQQLAACHHRKNPPPLPATAWKEFRRHCKVA